MLDFYGGRDMVRDSSSVHGKNECLLDVIYYNMLDFSGLILYNINTVCCHKVIVNMIRD